MASPTNKCKIGPVEAHYQCLQCGCQWKSPPGSISANGCIRCGHLYMKWLNYETMFRKQKTQHH